MRPLLRYSLSVLVLCCILFSNSFCGIALAESSTTNQSYDIMLLDSVSDFDLKMQVGSYDMRTDSYTWGSSMNYTSTDGIISASAGAGTNLVYNSYTGCAVRFTFSNFGKLSDLRAMLGRINISLYDSLDTSTRARYYMYTDKYRVMTSFADFNFSGSLQNGYTHLSSSASSTESITPNVLSNYPGMSLLQLLFDLNVSPAVPDVSLWKNYVESEYGNSVYNVGVDSFTCTFVFYINDAFRNDTKGYFLNNVSEGDDIRFYVWIGNNVASLSGDSYGDTSGIGALTSTINTSISSLGDSLGNQISQVKTQITNSTKTITTKIDTMSEDIQTGLQNVVESAQQNTQNIINTVTQKVDEVKTGITEVKDSILDLPNKISEMLIGLVVPDEQTMIEQRDNWDNLLAERFGAVYESVEVMDSIAAAFQSSAETSTITLPAVTVGLAGTDFTFGGYDVEVVPEGFDSLVTALKLIIDIVVTLAFINAMKSRYEQLVSR